MDAADIAAARRSAAESAAESPTAAGEEFSAEVASPSAAESGTVKSRSMGNSCSSVSPMLTPARLWVTAMRFEPMTWWFKSRPTYCALMTMRERFCPVSRSCHSDEHNEPTTTTGMPFSSDARMLMAN